ncbi:MAG: hypothetical protein GXY44_16580 [Phycisphaerales bacterium]|nr:hypothetical protein [Phycisphaerales bacterium]
MILKHTLTYRRSWSAILLLLAGCSDFDWSLPLFSRKPTETRPAGTLDETTQAMLTRNSRAMAGTVGEVTYLRGAQGLRVRGYGLVVGLPGTGGTNCQPTYRDHVAREVRRAKSANPNEWPRSATADDILNSPNTAVVQVDAIIPVGALKGRRLDVTVRAVDLDSTSLAGGILKPCELKLYNPDNPQLEGRTHATAQGTVFVNPFVSESEGATVANFREGRILGGGINTENRRMSLVLTFESYSTVRQVETAINQRFKSTQYAKIADGISSTNVDINLPEEYKDREMQFLRLVRHLPLSVAREVHERRAGELIGELAQPDAPWEDVALSLEGLGKTIIPILREHYPDTRPHVNYYTARTGLRLMDDTAIEGVLRHARDRRSIFRQQAIRELGTCAMPGRAGPALKELLGDPDVSIRIAAYEALRTVDPGMVEKFIVGAKPVNFILEVVFFDGPPLIYVRRTEEPRIALIGGPRMMFRPPLLYADSGKPLTLSASVDADTLSIVRKNPQGEVIAGPARAPLAVAPLVRFLGENPERDINGALRGFGISYADIIDLLFRLSKDGAINADARWEQPSVEELIGPLAPLERPESEL